MRCSKRCASSEFHWVPVNPENSRERRYSVWKPSLTATETAADNVKITTLKSSRSCSASDITRERCPRPVPLLVHSITVGLVVTGWTLARPMKLDPLREGVGTLSSPIHVDRLYASDEDRKPDDDSRQRRI